jgi:hypothetical protein
MLIPRRDAADFLRIYEQLMHYAGREREVIAKDMTFKAFDRKASLKTKAECRDAIYEPEPLFEAFLAAAGDNLSEKDRSDIQAWNERHVRDRFILLKHLPRYTVFMDT